MSKLVIFQNYFTPYREQLFEEIGRQVELLVIYLQKPEDEGRIWPPKLLQHSYAEKQLSYTKIGPFMINSVKEMVELIHPDDGVILLDNLPNSFSMFAVLQALKKVIPKKRLALWVEHTLDAGGDSPLKQLYRQFTSKTLAQQCGTLFAFSKKTKTYLTAVGAVGTQTTLLHVPQSTYTKKRLTELKERTSILRKDTMPFTFGYIGYFTERKGVLDLIRAFMRMEQSNIRLRMVGEGPLRPVLEDESSDDSRISVLPYVKGEEEKDAFFNSIHVLVVPSQKDPWAVVTSEAFAHGVPAITSEFVGSKELTDQLPFVSTFTPYTAVSLRMKMEEYARLHKTQKYEELRKATYAIIEKYAIEHAAEPFLQFAQDIFASSGV